MKSVTDGQTDRRTKKQASFYNVDGKLKYTHNPISWTCVFVSVSHYICFTNFSHMARKMLKQFRSHVRETFWENSLFYYGIYWCLATICRGLLWCHCEHTVTKQINTPKTNLIRAHVGYVRFTSARHHLMMISHFACETWILMI